MLLRGVQGGKVRPGVVGVLKKGVVFGCGRGEACCCVGARW